MYEPVYTFLALVVCSNTAHLKQLNQCVINVHINTLLLLHLYTDSGQRVRTSRPTDRELRDPATAQNTDFVPSSSRHKSSYSKK